MLKISKQTREAFKRIQPCTRRVDEGKWDNDIQMQALEAFRRETLDEAIGAWLKAFQAGDPYSEVDDAIEALKENPNDQ